MLPVNWGANGFSAGSIWSFADRGSSLDSVLPAVVKDKTINQTGGKLPCPYLVHFPSNVFSFEAENREVTNNNNQQIEEGSLLIRARFYSLMKCAPFWHVPQSTDDPSLLF
jgi:hypothetical protein